eukprot:730451-Pelagomonas_calceolata.AAC.1
MSYRIDSASAQRHVGNQVFEHMSLPPGCNLLKGIVALSYTSEVPKNFHAKPSHAHHQERERRHSWPSSYLQHVAHAVRPNNSNILYAAFIGFKQAYNTIPREALWQHLHHISMPKSLLSLLQDMHVC